MAAATSNEVGAHRTRRRCVILWRQPKTTDDATNDSDGGEEEEEEGGGRRRGRSPEWMREASGVLFLPEAAVPPFQWGDVAPIALCWPRCLLLLLLRVGQWGQSCGREEERVQRRNSYHSENTSFPPSSDRRTSVPIGAPKNNTATLSSLSLCFLSGFPVATPRSRDSRSAPRNSTNRPVWRIRRREGESLFAKAESKNNGVVGAALGGSRRSGGRDGPRRRLSRRNDRRQPRQMSARHRGNFGTSEKKKKAKRKSGGILRRQRSAEAPDAKCATNWEERRRRRADVGRGDEDATDDESTATNETLTAPTVPLRGGQRPLLSWPSGVCRRRRRRRGAAAGFQKPPLSSLLFFLSFLPKVGLRGEAEVWAIIAPATASGRATVGCAAAAQLSSSSRPASMSLR